MRGTRVCEKIDEGLRSPPAGGGQAFIIIFAVTIYAWLSVSRLRFLRVTDYHDFAWGHSLRASRARFVAISACGNR